MLIAGDSFEEVCNLVPQIGSRLNDNPDMVVTGITATRLSKHLWSVSVETELRNSPDGIEIHGLAVYGNNQKTDGGFKIGATL